MGKDHVALEDFMDGMGSLTGLTAVQAFQQMQDQNVWKVIINAATAAQNSCWFFCSKKNDGIN